MDLKKINPTMIDSPEELARVARWYGVRRDWHEPDEQGLTATVVGHDLDNAVPTIDSGEMTVVVAHEGKPVFAINLAKLLAWGMRPLTITHLCAGNDRDVEW